MLKEFTLVCVTESELLQWQARGLIHLASSRVLRSGMSKAPLFSLAPFVKLDDAKARVVVRLTLDFCADELIHPSFGDPIVLSIPWERIQGVSPVLPQFRRRLDSFNVSVEDWDLTPLWEEWLVSQGCYERLKAIQSILKKIGFNDNSFLSDSRFLHAIIVTVVRPQSSLALSLDIPTGWRSIFQNRDEILKKLRFEGHSDRVSFLEASLSEIRRLNDDGADLFKFSEPMPDRDSGWQFQDLSSSVLSEISRTGVDDSLSMRHRISPMFGAAYLRLYDELFYGQKSWPLCFNLLRFLKYSVASQETDILTASILASYPPEELRALNLPARFYNFFD